MPDEVARIGALSNGSNGQRSLESASLHFEPVFRRERGGAELEFAAEILSDPKAVRGGSKDLCFEPIWGHRNCQPEIVSAASPRIESRSEKIF
jgi:hypothetical protein